MADGQLAEVKLAFPSECQISAAGVRQPARDRDAEHSLKLTSESSCHPSGGLCETAREEGIELTLPLRGGVRWHDGKTFTARDVKCTWELLTGRSPESLRLNPRKTWYSNLEEVTTNGECEVTFHLKRPQPSFLALLASGWPPVYPRHVSPRDMHPARQPHHAPVQQP